MPNVAQPESNVNPEIPGGAFIFDAYDDNPTDSQGVVRVYFTQRMLELSGNLAYSLAVEIFLEHGGKYLPPRTIAGCEVGGYILPMDPANFDALIDPNGDMFFMPDFALVPLVAKGGQS